MNYRPVLLTFYAIKYLPISIATLLMNTSSLFVPLLLFFFKVRTPLKVLACSFMGFIGVSIIMLTNGSMNINPIHVGYALGAAVLAAMAFISLQELNKHNSPKNIVFYFHLLYWRPWHLSAYKSSINTTHLKISCFTSTY